MPDGDIKHPECALPLPWRSENGWAAPRRFQQADDTMSADVAYRLASEGVGLLWTGDFQNARQLLQALGRRTARRPVKYSDLPYPERFHKIRLARSQRARTMGMLLLAVDSGHQLRHRRAPDIRLACEAAYGEDTHGYVVPLTELLGVISAYEWRKKGVDVPALGAAIHPHYGVFAPTRSEYLDLVVRTPLPGIEMAFDIGTGTGVLAALLVKKGMKKVIATDINPSAIACAAENIARLGMHKQVQVKEMDLFPFGQADLVICNPPWLPGRPSSTLEQAIYDPDQAMLNHFLSGAAAHLKPGGQAWLIMSDLAEHLGLRSRADLLEKIEHAGLEVLERIDTRPVHPKSLDPEDPLADARRLEITSLWRLGRSPK